MADAIEAAEIGQIATLIVLFDLQTKKCWDSTIINCKQEKLSINRDAHKNIMVVINGKR